MNDTRFVFTGVEEFKAQLRALPAELTGEASHIVEAAANGAGVTLRTVYGQHRHTGNLQDHVVVEKKSTGPFGVSYRVASTSPIAWLFDNGSQARHWASGKSTGAMWGKTPPTHVFVRTLIAARRRMYDGLRGLMTRAGLQVTGEP
jgi:hypothetical protein